MRSAPRGADGAMAAEHRRAAVGDGVQGAVLRARQAVHAPIVGAVSADDVGEFKPVRTVSAGAHVGGRRRRHGSGAGGFR